MLESSQQHAKVQSLSFETDAAFVKLNAKFVKLQNDNEKCLATSEVLTKNFHAIIDKVDTVQRALKLKENDAGALNDVVNQKCLIENEKLLRFKRELSLIDMECEKVEWIKGNRKVQSCNLKNLKISHEEFEIKNVISGHRGQPFDGSNIEELKAFNEQVPYLPVNLAEKFSNLKILTFIDCGLTFVNTKVLENLGKLQNLTLSRNLIKGISAEGFKNLSSLIDLDLSNNKLEKFKSNSFESLNELLVLKLNNNLLVELSEKSFANLKKLKFLFLQKNILSIIPPTLLEPLRKLEMADFKDNSCVNLEVTRESSITIRSMKIYFEENCMVDELRQL